MRLVSQRHFTRAAAVPIVPAVFHEAVTIPASFQPPHRAAPVLARPPRNGGRP